MQLFRPLDIKKKKPFLRSKNISFLFVTQIVSKLIAPTFFPNLFLPKIMILKRDIFRPLQFEDDIKY